jgi:hypothetical protein
LGLFQRGLPWGTSLLKGGVTEDGCASLGSREVSVWAECRDFVREFLERSEGPWDRAELRQARHREPSALHASR